MNLCIHFFVEGLSNGKMKEYLTDERARKHLKTLLYGIGEVRENIIIDFSLNHTETITQYGNFKEAWQQLDVSQREFIAAFRHLLGKAYINPHSRGFVQEFFCDLVRERFNEHLNEVRKSESLEVLPKSQQILLASKSHREIVEMVGACNEVQSYEAC